MRHATSAQDWEFKRQVESLEFPVPDFDHEAHLRLVYTYLVDHDVAESVQLMRKALTGLLKKAGVEPSEKYHETLTEAWVRAVRHFMAETESCESTLDFIGTNRRLLDSRIMMTHYSAELLFSDQARTSFVAPDLEPIPTHEA
jgi:hypothetical protein